MEKLNAFSQFKNADNDVNKIEEVYKRLITYCDGVNLTKDQLDKMYHDSLSKAANATIKQHSFYAVSDLISDYNAGKEIDLDEKCQKLINSNLIDLIISGVLVEDDSYKLAEGGIAQLYWKKGTDQVPLNRCDGYQSISNKAGEGKLYITVVPDLVSDYNMGKEIKLDDNHQKLIKSNIVNLIINGVVIEDESCKSSKGNGVQVYWKKGTEQLPLSRCSSQQVISNKSGEGKLYLIRE